ncbi:transporter substrate-binding domain-containing protein [Microbulbifer elongatus]|uniref:transporter substrate-binding domain-containing protein n=1 Tax=Microbulbifer elongatus TaxID=86173 RepID=UPI001CFDB2A7|nr:transporter substrate-binding domain-containing protein [Microbulbifer elongatus]
MNLWCPAASCDQRNGAKSCYRIAYHVSGGIASIAKSLCTLLLTAALVLIGCGQDTGTSLRQAGTVHPAGESKRQAKTHPINYIETGDLEAIKKRGMIRFVGLTAIEDEMLPRKSIVTLRHYGLALELANNLGLEAHWTQVGTPAKALQLLKEGKADVLAGNLTSTETRQQQFGLSEHIARSRQQLVTGEHGPKIENIEDLKGQTLSVLAGSTFADTAKALQEKVPNLTIKEWEIQEADDIDILIDKLNAQKDTISIFDSDTLQRALQYRHDITPGAYVSEAEDIVWAVRKDASKLRLSINNFFTKKLVKPHEDRGSSWADIKKSRVLRLLTYNGPTSYFMWKGTLMGFDYDLAMKFAKKHDLELEVIVVPYDESLVEWLEQNKGDIAGASTTITPERKKMGIAFSAPYLEIPEQILSHSKHAKIANLQDLNGKTVTVRAFSSFIDTAKKLQQAGIDLELKIADPTVSYAQLANMVASGEVAITIADANAVEIAASLHDTLVPGVIVTDPREQGWMVKTENRKLLEKVSEFIREYRKTDDYAKTVKAYFKPSGQFNKKLAARLKPGEDLSPYDSLVKEVALDYEVDWRLITAQMWQESSFDPQAESPVGAQGLLQVMPRTAKDMGYPPPLFEPERAVQAGVKYLDWIRNRFDSDITLENRLWFALAAYNAGIGHLYDAQRLANELGYDPHVWFDNVEKAMLKLSEPRYFSKARYGYARGAEPVQYVRNISKLYQAYTDLTSGDVTARALQTPSPVAPSAPTAPRTPKTVKTGSFGSLIPEHDISIGSSTALGIGNGERH